MKRLLLSVVVCFILLNPSTSKASHAAGAELRYENIGGNNYIIYFILYRDCSGIAVSSQYTILGISDCGGGNVSITVTNDSTVEVSQICASEVSQCIDFGSLYMGVEANYYHGYVTLPSPCDSWTFGISPSICNRNAAITNLNNPVGFCTYVEAKINNLYAPDNSSPIFTALPLFHLCTQYQEMHLYAQDPDGDSLAFEMYTPHSDPVSDIQYLPGLSANQPVTFTNPGDSTTFNPVTGDIRFIANAAQITVVGVRVNEFRNGILIGSTERDIEVVFDNCTNHAPTASGLNGSPFFTSHICADSICSYHINTIDIDADSVRISWQNNIPGSTISLAGINNQQVIFNWQPSSSHISTHPYSFIVYVTDSTCGYVYFNSYQYYIYVDSCFATGLDNTEQVFLFNASYSTADQTINYNYESVRELPGKLSLSDLQGRILWTQEMKSEKKSDGKIPASSLSPGIYLLQMKTDSGFSKSIKVLRN